MKYTIKSQEERPAYCRKCYVPMKKQLKLPNLGEDYVGFDWLCEKCGLRWEVRPGSLSARSAS